jgi:hypothetical protein
MKQKTLYTCEVCHTDYNDPDKATECEGSHSLPESVASCKFLPYCEYPERVQIKFKNGKRIEYKKVSGGAVMMNADLISRSDLMRRLERKKCGVHDKTYTDGFNDAILRVRSMVNGAAACPTTDWKSVLIDGLPPLPRCEHTLSNRLLLTIRYKSVIGSWESIVDFGYYSSVSGWLYSTKECMASDLRVSHWMDAPKPAKEMVFI